MAIKRICTLLAVTLGVVSAGGNYGYSHGSSLSGNGFTLGGSGSGSLINGNSHNHGAFANGNGLSSVLISSSGGGGSGLNGGGIFTSGNGGSGSGGSGGLINANDIFNGIFANHGNSVSIVRNDRANGASGGTLSAGTPFTLGAIPAAAAAPLPLPPPTSGATFLPTVMGAMPGLASTSGVVSAAVLSNHLVNTIDVPSNGNVQPTTIDVPANMMPVNFVFRSASSAINVAHQHEGARGSVKETASQDEPHILLHTVTKPIMQEVREIISPMRRIVQEVEPVREEIKTFVARGIGHSKAPGIPLVSGQQHAAPFTVAEHHVHHPQQPLHHLSSSSPFALDGGKLFGPVTSKFYPLTHQHHHHHHASGPITFATPTASVASAPALAPAPVPIAFKNNLIYEAIPAFLGTANKGSAGMLKAAHY